MVSADPATPASRTLHREVRGTGPDVVLLHGWGFDHRAWGPFADTLGRYFRLHLVDLPGHGRSSAIPFSSLDDAAARIADCVPAHATVCGWSLGGVLAMKLARHSPAVVRRLVLIATTPRFARGDDWAFAVPPPTLEAFRAAMARDGAVTRRDFAALVAHGGADARAQARALTALCDSGPPPDLPSLNRALEVLHAADLRLDATTLASPALIVHGRQDAVIRAEAAQWLADHLGREAGAPPPALKLLELAGHAPFLDEPQAVAQAIVDWHG